METTPTESSPFSFRTFLRSVGEVFLNIILILGIVVLIRMYLISPYHVSGQSMVPTLEDGDYIIADKLSYQFSGPQFGDIIVFTPPTPRMEKVKGIQCLVAQFASFTFSDRACILPDFFIKRVIGTPGDTVEIKDGDVLVNGKIIEEHYLSSVNAHHTWLNEEVQYHKYIVPAGKYFVMGDNRTGSSDSRAHAREWSNGNGVQDPFVQKSDIEGKLLFVLFSPFSLRSQVQALQK